MSLCKEKKESIKSGTIGIYETLKPAWKEKRLNDQEWALTLAYLKKIEGCTNLEKTYRDVEAETE